MKKTLGALLLAVLLSGAAHAGSTVNPNVPATSSNLTSAPIRGNFAATFTDINNLLTGFAAPNAPTNPSVGQFWRKTNVSPQIIYQWSGSAWLQYSTFDTGNNRVTPYFGNNVLAWQQLLTGTGGLGTSGQCLTSTGPTTVPTAQNCVSAATVNATQPLSWDPGTLTMSLGYTSSFTTSGGNLALSSTILSGGPSGSGTLTPIITWNQFGQLTSVSTVAITPPFSAITGQATLSQLPNIANNTVLGNVSGGSAVPSALSTAQLTTLVNLASGSLSGAVPAWPGTTNTFFRGDGTYAQPSAANLTNGTTGSGAVVLANTPTLITPVLGVATATSINGLTITGSTGSLTVANGKTLTASNSLTLAGTNGTTLTFQGTGTVVNRDSVDTLTNKTYDTAGTGNSFSINGLAATANTGTGAVVRATSPALVTPSLGVATATSVNGLTITASTGTLTIANSKTLTANNSLTFTGTDATSFAFPGSSDTVVTLAAAQTLTNKSIVASQLTGTLQAAQFPALTGDVTTSAGSLGTTIALNSVTNAKSAQMAGPTLKGNPTNATADPSDIVISSLTQSIAPDVNNDMLLIWDSVAGNYKKINPNTIASASVAGVASIDAKTGVFTTSTGITTVVNDIQLAAIAADTLLMNATGGSAVPTSVSVGNCATALSYSTSGHAFSCRTATGTGDMVQATSPTLVTPALGVATATSINKVVVTAPATSATLTIANGKTLTANNSITFSGTDSTTMTFPSTSANVTQTIASGTKALATSAISSGTCTTAQTDTATGAVTSDAPSFTFASDPTGVTGYTPATTGMLSIVPWVTSNTINFKVCNITSSSITPGSISINWRVTR